MLQQSRDVRKNVKAESRDCPRGPAGSGRLIEQQRADSLHHVETYILKFVATVHMCKTKNNGNFYFSTIGSFYSLII
jgi:hypothetical protein